MGMKAFSLIELMVVIAIVGVLSAVAVPAYKQYQIRAKISSGITILQGVAAQLIERRQRGDSVIAVYNGLDYSSGNNTSSMAFNAPPAVALTYYDLAAVANGNKPFLIGMDIGGLDGITPPYAAPAGGGTLATVQHARIYMYIVEDAASKTYKSYCGNWSAAAASTEIPYEYLPPGCNQMSGLCYANSDGLC